MTMATSQVMTEVATISSRRSSVRSMPRGGGGRASIASRADRLT